MNKVVLVILTVLLGVSLFFNYSQFKNFKPQPNLSEPERKAKEFLDANRNDIDMLIFQSGAVEEGVILDETPISLTFRYLEGTTDYKKSEIRKIVYNVYRKEKTNSDTNGFPIQIAIAVIGSLIFLLLVSGSFNIYLLRSRKLLSTQMSASSQETQKTDKDVLIMKNGGKEEGHILKETDDALVLKSLGGTAEYNKSDIEKIIYNLNRQRNQNPGEAA